MRKYLISTYLLAFALIANAQNSINDFSLMSSFCQGSANNCASIALIKAAMAKFGYNKIFSYDLKDNIYKVKLKDGTKLQADGAELLSAIEYSHFDTTGSYQLLGNYKDSVLFYAYLSYACIAKNIEQNGYWGCSDNNGNSAHIKKIRGYEKALSFISRTSYCTDNCHRLLGFKIQSGRIYDYDGSAPLNDKGTILYSWGHAVAVYNNQLDCHGEWRPVTTDKVCYNRFKWYVVLE